MAASVLSVEHGGERLGAMVLWSLLFHAVVLAGMLTLPSLWRSSPIEPPKGFMNVDLVSAPPPGRLDAGGGSPKPVRRAPGAAKPTAMSSAGPDTPPAPPMPRRVVKRPPPPPDRVPDVAPARPTPVPEPDVSLNLRRPEAPKPRPLTPAKPEPRRFDPDKHLSSAIIKLRRRRPPSPPAVTAKKRTRRRAGTSRRRGGDSIAARIAALKRRYSGHGPGTKPGNFGVRGGTGTGGGGTILSIYAFGVKQRIMKHLRRVGLPPSLQRRALKATIVVKVLRSGHLVSTSLLTGSGNSYFDRLVVNAVKGMKTFPPFPRGLRRRSLEFSITINSSAAG